MRAWCMAVAMIFTLVLPACAQSPEGSWRILSLAGVETLSSDKATLEIAADGKAVATVGCNRLIASARFSGSSLSFGKVAATMMACPPPLDKEERALAGVLTDTASFRIEDGRLTLLSEAGSVLATLDTR
jgi:heat shock protein HslJ